MYSLLGMGKTGTPVSHAVDLGTGDTPDTGVLTEIWLRKVYLLICLGALVDETIGP